MKIKFNYITVLICLFSLVSCILISGNCNAQSNRAEVSFLGEPTYRLLSAVEKGDLEGWTYEINVTLKNIGDKKSDPLIVTLQNETETLIHSDIVVEAENTSKISFIWSTISSEDQDFTVSFSPVNEETPKNSYNGGSTSFSIIIGDVDKTPAEDTPGFELVIVILSFILSMIWFYKRR